MKNLWFKIQVWLEQNCWPILWLFRRIIYGQTFRRIPLTRWLFAKVDPRDYRWLMLYKWCVCWTSKRRRYAVSYSHKGKTGKRVLMHRLIINAPKNLLVDHYNHNTLDNHRLNLRLASNFQNQCNVLGKKRKNSLSKYRGVSRNKHSPGWIARIQADGKRIKIGTFKKQKAAAHAYDKAALKYHGQFAMLNFSK